ncbi:MAG: hypothetical protein ACYTGZ_12360 [Planctomycetota bacterium]|jgi:hypothetical protein
MANYHWRRDQLHSGPPPVNVPFTPHTGEQLFMASGTVRAIAAGTVGYRIMAGGAVLASTQMHASGPGVHVTPPAIFEPTALPPQTTVAISVVAHPAANTEIDPDDYFTITIAELEQM